MELTDGDRCYHLIVPKCNDWMVTHSSVTPKTYCRANYRNCVCSHSKVDLEEKAKKIKDLFRSIPECKLASSEGETFYRIMLRYPSDILTINYKSNTEDHTLLENQLQYKNNYIKDEDYTIMIANQVCKILELPPMVHKHH